MKKIYTLITAFIFFTLFTGCEENDIATYSGPEFVQFAQSTAKFSVKEKGEKTYELLVGTTQPSTTDLTLSIEVDTKNSTAIEGRDFRLLTPVVTIPAGEISTTVKIESMYKNLTPEGVKLVLLIKGADELINPHFGNSCTLNLSQFYELSMEKLVGTYVQKSTDPDGNSYENEVSVKKLTDNSIEIYNLSNFGSTVKANVNFEETTISILPGQALLKDFTDPEGKNHGDLIMFKAVLNGWELQGVYEDEPIRGECRYTGQIFLDTWVLGSKKTQLFFAAFERTVFTPKK